MPDIQTIITERRKSHGDFTDVSFVAQRLKTVLRNAPSWPRMNDVQKESAEAICSKLARVVCGDPGFPDHWIDLSGYPTLAAERLP